MNLVLSITVAGVIAASVLNTGQTKLNAGQTKIASGSGKLGFVISDFVHDIKLGESKLNKNPSKYIPQVAAAESIKAASGKVGLGLQPIVVSVTVKSEETEQPASTLNSPSPEPSGQGSQGSTSSAGSSPTPCPSPSFTPENTSDQEDTGNQEDEDTRYRKYEDENVLGVLFSFADRGFSRGFDQLRNSQYSYGNNPCDSSESGSGGGSQTFDGGVGSSEDVIDSGSDQGGAPNEEPGYQEPTASPSK